jgi:hypothetical protein
MLLLRWAWMGRQIGFYALPADLREFLDVAARRDPVGITLMDTTDQAEVEQLSSPETEKRTMTLWRRDWTPNLRRTLIRRDCGPDYYRLDISLPVLEITPSTIVEWNGQPGLIAGRVYGFNFDPANEAYARWYAALARWIRSHFVRNPLGPRLGGYVGKAALEWFRQGGNLLANFKPPDNHPGWLELLGNQAEIRATLTPPDPQAGETRR